MWFLNSKKASKKKEYENIVFFSKFAPQLKECLDSITKGHPKRTKIIVLIVYGLCILSVVFYFVNAFSKKSCGDEKKNETVVERELLFENDTAVHFFEKYEQNKF